MTSKKGGSLIERLGMQEKVRHLLSTHGGSARSVVTILGRDPDFRQAMLTEGMERRKLFASDIYDFQTAESMEKQKAEHAQELEEVKALVRKDPAKQDIQVTTKARELFLKTTNLADDWWRIADRSVHILDDEMQEFVERKDENKPITFNQVTGEPIFARFPVELLDTTRKAVLASLEFAGKIKNDQAVKNIVNAQNLTVQQGMSLKEFHENLFGIAKELHLSQNTILEAFSKAQAKKNGQTIIDTVPLPPEPEWRTRQREERLRQMDAEEADAPPEGSNAVPEAVSDEEVGASPSS